MIPKSNNPSNSSDTYLPTTLLPSLSKIFVKLIVFKIFTRHDSGPLPKYQFDFRKKYFPNKYANFILSYIHSKPMKKTFTSFILLEISGAFDHA